MKQNRTIMFVEDSWSNIALLFYGTE